MHYIAVQNLNRATVNYHLISEKANQIYATVQFFLLLNNFYERNFNHQFSLNHGFVTLIHICSNTNLIYQLG